MLYDENHFNTDIAAPLHNTCDPAPNAAGSASTPARPPLPEDPKLHDTTPFPSHVLNAGLLTISLADRVGDEYLIYA